MPNSGKNFDSVSPQRFTTGFPVWSSSQPTYISHWWFVVLRRFPSRIARSTLVSLNGTHPASYARKLPSRCGQEAPAPRTACPRRPLHARSASRSNPRATVRASLDPGTPGTRASPRRGCGTGASSFSRSCAARPTPDWSCKSLVQSPASRYTQNPGTATPNDPFRKNTAGPKKRSKSY